MCDKEKWLTISYLNWKKYIKNELIIEAYKYCHYRTQTSPMNLTHHSTWSICYYDNLLISKWNMTQAFSYKLHHVAQTLVLTEYYLQACLITWFKIDDSQLTRQRKDLSTFVPKPLPCFVMQYFYINSQIKPCGITFVFF